MKTRISGVAIRSSILCAAIAQAAITAACTTIDAQKPPAVRQIGRLERVTSDSLASVASALPLRDGRVLVNDRIARRVLLYDSTLTHASVVADTTAATANAYGARPASLIRYRGDSALLIDQSSLSMFVIGPSGAIAHVMAIPRAEDAQALNLDTGVDALGRLVYFNALGSLPGVVMLGRGDPVFKNGKPTALSRFNAHLDSAYLVRVDLATRVLDSVTALRIPKLDREMRVDDQGGLTAIATTYDPLPIVDAWTVMPDGSIPVVRGRDYHVDWLSPDGHWTSSPKMPFDWQHVDDARKQALIDSTVARWQDQYDRIMSGAARGGRGGSNLAPMIVARPALASVPDYIPPFTPSQGSALNADADGNLWIRTTTVVDGRPVYDVVNRRGELFDRVQLPPFRTIAGFGPGVIYMAVKDSAGVVHLERARIK
ncbi:MAG TPA: hypothetical protein VII52_13030 [Gemmatimonadaceae bacterium]